jgi:hypothetical protein
MSHTRLWAAAAIIALIVLGSFVFSVPHTRDATIPRVAESKEVAPIVRITESYKRGTRTLKGTLTMPDACGRVSAVASPAQDGTEHIVVQVTLEPSSGICLELPTEASFSVQFDASEQTPVTVFVNGHAASTTTS